MNSPDGSAFVTTRWTQVLAARGDSESARVALSELCSTYYGPVVAFLSHTRSGGEDPREVAHEFFARLLERDGVGGAEPARGRFRSYLLGAVKHHLANRRIHQAREKRGGSVEHQSIHAADDPAWELPIAVDSPQMEILFDREWALAVVERALAALEQEAVAGSAARQYTELKAWLSFDDAPESQAAVALRLGMNQGAVKVAVHRLRRRFRELVRSEVAQTLPVGDDIDAEMHHLVESLARSPAG